VTKHSDIIDLATFGRRLRAARILAGFDTVAPALEHIRQSTGLPMTERTLGALERGDQMPTLEQFVAVQFAFRPPGGAPYWWTCLRPDIAKEWAQVHTPEAD